MAQDAETEVLVEATGSGLVQHLWAPIHSVQLEEAPSVQLRLGVAGGGLSHSSDLPSPNWVSEPGEGSAPCRKCSPSVWDPRVRRAGVCGGVQSSGARVKGSPNKWGAQERAGDPGRPHLGSHQAGATGHIQDPGSMRRARKGLGKAVHCEAWGTVPQGGDVLGTER